MRDAMPMSEPVFEQLRRRSRFDTRAIHGEKERTMIHAYHPTTQIADRLLMIAESAAQLATYMVGALLMRARSSGCTNATVLTDGHPGFFARYGFTLTPVDSIVSEMHLSKEFLRRFGVRTHYVCRSVL
ncbi:GNAT family N-acetyltransferase [Cupriavidus basilensis]